jgi:uncharacterized membrane protein
MSAKAAITVLRDRQEIERLWHDPRYRPEYVENAGATVSFREAPGDRGTEIHVELERRSPVAKVSEMVQKLTGTESLARVKDELRRFKQLVETGEVARSEATPEGESLKSKLRQRPGQPLQQAELREVGA